MIETLTQSCWLRGGSRSEIFTQLGGELRSLCVYSSELLHRELTCKFILPLERQRGPNPISDQHSAVEFPSQNLVDGARLELALHGCRPWVTPYRNRPFWGEMRESNSRGWSHNPVPMPFGQRRRGTEPCGFLYADRVNSSYL
jgi:hypothetical protein